MTALPIVLTAQQIRCFQKKVYGFYHKNKRDLPWRKNVTPYRVFVSEIMLQQTQVDRVCCKFKQFVGALPSMRCLAAASLSEIMTLWQGLGYNRRAVNLKKAAEIIVRQYHGRLPQTTEALEQLPGIGPATARSIGAFAFNAPVVFIETNVRSVFLHEFFPGKSGVHDNCIEPLVAQALDRLNVRDWYSALMDYGVWLKKAHVNPSRASRHYTRQSKFEGSRRQLRGRVLRFLIDREAVTLRQLITHLGAHDERLEAVLSALIQEHMIIKKAARFQIAE